MSIWESIQDAGDLVALNGDSEAANYRAEGEPTVVLDVATTHHHKGIRLSLWEDAGAFDIDVILSISAAADLRERLTVALERS